MAKRIPVLRRAKELIKKGQVELLSILPQTIIGQVGEYVVTRKKMRGYSVDTCGCGNHARHPDGRCAHKDAFVAYLVMRGI